ncbi:DUF1385 domain-containing protein [Alkalicoccus saliphilus]|uniref:DUF1385 domain-containing protein n=1 Tax=Alkalicoccus saliphilus TaxID=200989 RepID=A0A2T4UAR5_9BACI|nr:DUF1385 domain-containing protein [Alkalicoccus saliphilus]PTL40495.1 hypothetical protein C6Y45_00885 [Alkalicoccus saliphilus]
MVRGLSFPGGVMFAGGGWLSCAYYKKGKRSTWLRPLNMKAYFYAFWTAAGTFSVISRLIFFGIIVFLGGGASGIVPSLPMYIYLWLIVGFHFLFPKEMKKFHAAEHQVLALKGKTAELTVEKVLEKPVVNRHCSTNTALLYAALTIFLTLLAAPFLRFESVLPAAAYGALAGTVILHPWMKNKKSSFLKEKLLFLSAWIQKNNTTSPPEKKHVETALYAYTQLQQAVGKY